MGLKFGDFIEDYGPAGLVAGIGAAILAPVVVPAAARIGKPLAKSAIKGGIFLYEKSKGAFAEAGEVFEDVVAEARAELADEQQKSLKATETHPEVTPET